VRTIGEQKAKVKRFLDLFGANRYRHLATEQLPESVEQET